MYDVDKRDQDTVENLKTSYVSLQQSICELQSDCDRSEVQEEDLENDLEYLKGIKTCLFYFMTVDEAQKFCDSIDYKETKDSKKKLFLVECISQFRNRYVIECEKEEYAHDTIAEEPDGIGEMSQEYLGETVVSSREITEEEYLELFDKDNEYLKDWETEDKLNRIIKV